jgi:hypothetical protein
MHFHAYVQIFIHAYPKTHATFPPFQAYVAHDCICANKHVYIHAYMIQDMHAGARVCAQVSMQMTMHMYLCMHVCLRPRIQSLKTRNKTLYITQTCTKSNGDIFATSKQAMKHARKQSYSSRLSRHVCVVCMWTYTQAYTHSHAQAHDDARSL